MFCTNSARAQPEEGATRYRLVYAIPEGFECTSESNFGTGVEKHLGRAVFDSNASASVEVTTTRNEEQWTLLLRIVDEDGEVFAERALATRGSCEAVLSGGALALELLLEDTRRSRSGETEPAGSAELERSTEARNAEARNTEAQNTEGQGIDFEPSPPQGTRLLPAWDLSLGGAAYLKVVQDVALGWRGGIGYTFEMGLGVRIDVGQTQTVSEARWVEGVPVRLSMALKHVTLGASYAWYWDEVQRHQVGVHAHYGSLGMEVDGARPVGDGDVPWAAVGARAASQMTIASPLVLTASAEVLTPLLDDEFTEVGGTALHRLAPVGGFVGLGIGALW